MLFDGVLHQKWIRLTLLLLCGLSLANAATFGKVVPIGGTASDIALDEPRGLLYIANFTANRIDVMSTANNQLVRQIATSPQPGAVALSPDGNTLLIAQYQNGQTSPMGSNTITLRNLTSGAQQNLPLGSDAPLGAAFLGNGQALVATSTGLGLVNPQAGTYQSLTTYQDLYQKLPMTLPVPLATSPGQILGTALTASADGSRIWGMTVLSNSGANQQVQLIFMYDGKSFTADVWTTTPPLLPRVSVAADGSWAMIGWSAFAPAQCGRGFMIRSRYPNVALSTNITGHAIDSRNGIMYGQIFDPNQPAGPPYKATPTPSLAIMDADNLTVRDWLRIPENLVGRAVLNSAGSVMYAISDSGITVLPVGSLGSAQRLAVSQEDVLVQSGFCNRNAGKQTFVISDPSGNSTDFMISSSQKGVTVSPAKGTTPATVTVTVDANAFPATFGTTAATLQISSNTAVNLPLSVRLLLSAPDVDQQGNIVQIPGKLTDILADPARNQYYVLRQDKNQVLVYDGTSNQLKATLRTQTTPAQMSFSSDHSSLLVAHQDSQLLLRYDLGSGQPQTPIMLPPSHFGRSIAQSNNATLVLAEDDSQGPTLATVDRIDFETSCAISPASLGIYVNPPVATGSAVQTGPVSCAAAGKLSTTLPATTVLSASPDQQSILLASQCGDVMLYSAAADTWVLSRRDFTALSGAYAVSMYAPNQYSADGSLQVPVLAVVGDNLLDQSLVPIGALDTSVGNTAGFAFTGAGGYRASATSAAGAGVMQNLTAFANPNAFPVANMTPVRVTEAPILPTTSTPFTRTVAPMPSSIVALTTSGVTVLPGNYAAAAASPRINSAVSAADQTAALASGGLMSIYGQQFGTVSMASSQAPLPTMLANSCVTLNGELAPLVYASPNQVNAQIPFDISGAATVVVHTPGGMSGGFKVNVASVAPSIFLSGTAGPLTGIATVFRASNNELVTASDPIHLSDKIVIYLTGMGDTVPAVATGAGGPAAPPAGAAVQPSVTLGGAALAVDFAGLVPGSAGVYEIDAEVPFKGVPAGFNIPLTITQGSSSTTTPVRVVY